MKWNILIAICLLAEAAGSAIAADHQKEALRAKTQKPACVHDSGLQVYFSAHRALEADLGI